ncbi:MAG: FlgD immunoglobulin-like domain containing protein, partial [Armatimonadota bacterium]|nr:FlgD immunoglobulin-like domain containing protein [Armatimonadota bacterium]
MRRWIYALVLSSGISAIAVAQGGEYNPFAGPCRCPDSQNPVSDDYFDISISNGVLGATLGISGTVTWLTGCFPIERARCTTRPAQGSIQIGTADGSSLITGDESVAMTSGYPWGVFPGGIYISMQTRREGQAQTFVWGREEGAPGVRFSQAWAGASGFYIRQIWNIEGWDTDLRIDLIQSVARISLRVRNVGDTAASMALRLASDVEVGVEAGFERFGASRPPYVYVQGQRPIKVYTDLRGVQIPNAIEFYLGRGILAGSSRYFLRPTKGFEDQTPIDRLVIGDWFYVQGTTIWEPVIFPDTYIGDVAINLFVNPRNFAPGQLREFVFYIALTPVDVDVQPPVAVGLEALPVIEPDRNDLTRLANNGEFIITANVTNQYFIVGREIDLTDISIDIALPQGVSLAPGQRRAQTIQRLAPGQTGSVSWRVIADPATVGFVTFRVAVQAPPAPTRTVSRTVLISATASRKFESGFQMVSIPFEVTGDVRDLFSNLPTAFQVKRWNPERETYQIPEVIRPGEGFWVYLPTPSIIASYNTEFLRIPENVFSQSVPVPLKRGWNMIGNPYPYPLILGQVVIVSSSDPRRSITFFEAAQRGVIRGVLYYWDEFTGEYKFTSDPNTPLLPHRGYWIKANEDIEFVFPPVFLPGTGFGGIPRSVPELPNRPNEWRVQIVARTREGADTQNFIGITSGATPAEVEEPPTPLPERAVNLTILKPGTGTPLMQELRPTANRHQFDLVVEAEPGEEITLTFPNLNTVPQAYRLRLLDLNTGRAMDLRTTPEYRFVSTGRTRLQIIVERATRTSALITSVSVGNAGRGVNSVSISYVLADDAQTSVQILTPDGRTVAHLQRGRAATRGMNTLAWNLRDDQGRAVPPGTYQVQVE